MAITPTFLKVTPTFEDKSVSTEGAIAVNEQVIVTVLGVVDITDPQNPVLPEGIVLRLTSLCGRTEYGRFPFDAEDVWAIDGENITGTMPLNTVQLQTFFANKCFGDVCEALIVLENGDTDNLYAKGEQVIGNWVQNPVDPVAGSAAMQAQIDTLTDRLAEHQHNAATEGETAFPHNNLTNRDVAGVHPTLEGAVADATSAASEALSAATTANNNATTANNTAITANNTATTALGKVEALEDDVTLPEITREMTGTEMKVILNQMRVYLNTIRSTT